ncbi:MAG: GGDEF domain-containing protein [Spirochaetaceae bacterium]
MLFKKMLIMLITLASLNSCNKIDNRIIPTADNGVIDLTGIEISGTNNIKLDGEWEFYWKEFLFSNVKGDRLIIPDYIKTPGSWADNTLYEAHGFATLRLLVHGLTPDSMYSLYIPDISSSYKLWADGKLISWNGVIGKNREQSRPEFLPKTVSFHTVDSSVEIIIHVSNYHYRKAGTWRSIIIGSVESLTSQSIKKVIMDIFMAGLLYAISVVHIRVYLYRKEEKIELYFGLICISLLIRIITTGEQLLTYLIPSIPWEVVRRLELIPFYFTAPMILIFLTILFPKESNKYLHRAYIFLSMILGVIFIFLPIRISNHFIPYAQAIVILGIVYLFIILFKAIKSGRSNAITITLAYAVFSLATISDILFANDIIQFMYISPYGFIILIFTQSDMLTERFTRSFSQRDILVKSRDKFRYASITDGLTGLYNARYLHKILEEEITKNSTESVDLAVIMLDVDNFKNYNDTYGHKQGDLVLKSLADVIKRSAREIDISCRYGGEEFTVILPRTTLSAAEDVAERIRTNFEKLKFTTVSIGVSEFIHGENVDQIIERADMALYKAKKGGKNRVELA